MKLFVAILSLTVAATAFGHESREIAGMQVLLEFSTQRSRRSNPSSFYFRECP